MTEGPLDSTYDSIRKREIVRNIDALKSATSAIENYATGYYLTGGFAQEVREIAERLNRLPGEAA